MSHIEEWKKIRDRYEKESNKPEIQFRIECITELIDSEENKQIELNHFK